MAHAWTFETAASCWSTHRDSPEEAWDAFESAEEFLLDHEPRTTVEVVRMIDVLVEQGGDRRTDGRDVAALERVQGFLRMVCEHATTANGPTSCGAPSKGGSGAPDHGAEISA